MATVTMPRHTSNYRWVMLILCMFSSLLVIALPMMSLPVLFDQIARELNLTLVQVGWVWGISSLTGMFIGLIGGVLGDRFGTRRVLAIACIMIGVFGATRGLAVDFVSFMITSFMMGLFAPFVGVNLHKVAGEWFSRRQLGLANGVISAGFASGFLLGSLLGASVLAPALGGWRPTMYFFGAISIIIGVIWFIVAPRDTNDDQTTAIPLTKGLPLVIQLPSIWLIAFGKLFLWSGLRGFWGYLPLYLRELNWTPNWADSALAIFFAFSLVGSIPISMLSDRWGVRKPFLILAPLLIGGAITVMGVADGWVVIAIVMIGGIMFDAFMGISITAATEIKNVGPALAGTAIGFIFLVQEIGGFLSPPLGNYLAEAFGPNTPFFFWGSLALLSIVFFYLFQPNPMTTE